MPPKGGNAKKESGRAKKAENEAKKASAAEAEKERKEAEKWAAGGKGGKPKEDKEEKRRAELLRKAENARILAEEEANAPAKVKTPPKAGAKKAAPKVVKPAGPGAIAAGGSLAGSGASTPAVVDDGKPAEVEVYSATGIDNAIDLLGVVTAKMDKASVGSQAANIERHPERRFMAAFEAYKEREMPKARQDHPGLRMQQYHDLLYKQFQKSPENPFNQVTVAYDASKDARVEALNQKNAEIAQRLREKSS
ncbi:Coiled-coil domain-containing protein 124 -like protein [Trametes pubescens]|uniref:Coiled-coil domain-containing protein 124-like protein n=1 Tax=Trametes pubescens TaxID=154538 RepID=A0A1M2VFC4_TRAPU|nr:Coiled-coil domain-containing protein 124 -like protein [Trametes pubescens]